jgi:hypothetical protein
MSTTSAGDRPGASGSTPPLHDVPVDWEALEDAFENNAPEVHSYLHMSTGEVMRVVDGVADPQMHVRIASDTNYLRIEPVSSREQYRWMERFIPTVEATDLRGSLTQAIDGKGAFRRFKDVLMTYAEERERWFAFRSERLRTFMEAWLTAHAIKPITRPAWAEPVLAAGAAGAESSGAASPAATGAAATAKAPDSAPESADESAPKSSSLGRRSRNADALRQSLRDVGELLGPRDLDLVVSFAEFLRARRAARGFAHHHEHMMSERAAAAAETHKDEGEE